MLHLYKRYGVGAMAAVAVSLVNYNIFENTRRIKALEETQKNHQQMPQNHQGTHCILYEDVPTTEGVRPGTQRNGIK